MYEAVVSITIYSKIKTSYFGVCMEYIAVVARERNHGSMMIR